MRLLSSKYPQSFELKQFRGNNIRPEYVILSHTWGAEEVLFHELPHPEQSSQDKEEGFFKIANCCALAKENNFDWVWIDSCCIDTSSSSEHSEAINSMYAWYSEAAVCYAYLGDVSDPEDEGSFKASRWFGRGWTLQELIAPKYVEFYCRDWSELGSKYSMRHTISSVTGIPIEILEGQSPFTCNVGQRMSWAAGRETTRIEDSAYCLLGLLNINLPMLYGEGEKAFYRFQEEILRHTEDFSIFACGIEPMYGILNRVSPTLAPSTEFFKASPKNRSIRDNMVSHQLSHIEDSEEVELARLINESASYDPPMVTSRGLRVTLALGEEMTIGSNQIIPAYMNSLAMPSGDMVCLLLQRYSLEAAFLLYGKAVSGQDASEYDDLSVVLYPRSMAHKFVYKTFYLQLHPSQDQMSLLRLDFERLGLQQDRGAVILVVYCSDNCLQARRNDPRDQGGVASLVDHRISIPLDTRGKKSERLVIEHHHTHHIAYTSANVTRKTITVGWDTISHRPFILAENSENKTDRLIWGGANDKITGILKRLPREGLERTEWQQFGLVLFCGMDS
jgi:hypothetical protein